MKECGAVGLMLCHLLRHLLPVAGNAHLRNNSQHVTHPPMRACKLCNYRVSEKGGYNLLFLIKGHRM